jgi:hypothetical protein
MLIGVGSGLLAEMLLPAGSEAKVRILLPPASDLRLLTLEFPDLGRLPPVPDDDREMSFAIQSLEVQLLNQPQDIGGLDSRSAIVLDNMVAGSALLIGGPGPVPDARLACKGRDTLLAPTSDGRGGWVICMLIGTDEIEAQALSLRLIGPSPAALPDLATLKMAVAPPLAADVTSTPVPMRIHIETPDLTQNNLALSSRGSGRTRGRLNWVRTKTGKAPPIN